MTKLGTRLRTENVARRSVHAAVIIYLKIWDEVTVFRKKPVWNRIRQFVAINSKGQSSDAEIRGSPATGLYW